jgi:hypothetical protein
MIEHAIEGKEISRVCVDFAVALETADGVELRIETTFSVTDSDGSPLLAANPGDLGEAASHILGLLGRHILVAGIQDSGRLELAFSGGGRLICEPNEEFEAWTLVAPNGERIVCLPGGGSVRWPRSP